MPALAFRTTLPKPDDPDILRIMAEATIAGHPIATAATMAGIGEMTARDWNSQGRADMAASPDTPPAELSSHALFAWTLKQAQAKLLSRCLKPVNDQIDEGNWVPGMTLAERRFPGEFGRNARPSVQSEPVSVNLYFVLPPEAQLALAQRQAELAQLRLQEGKRD